MTSTHTFHIPVLGIGYSIDTPLKVAKYGISSVISIVEDELIEKMRKVISNQYNKVYVEIKNNELDFRARRIKEYLNLLGELINAQVEKIKKEDFSLNAEITKYFQMLPTNSTLSLYYQKALEIKDEVKKQMAFQKLKDLIVPGSIDVNIMTKLDNLAYDKNGVSLGDEFSEAKSALRGFALSEIQGSVVFSAGLNPKLYSYCEQFDDFFPDEKGLLKKAIILKVSDFRSAQIQGKFLAKKGIWVSEFRIESGLNCGGHAFATQGLLLGPILEEFKQKRHILQQELFEICQASLLENNKVRFKSMPFMKISAQGGIGTAEENEFLLNEYQLDSTGWGSPFLLVPECTNVDDATLKALINSKQEDFYLSNSSPLGVPFNNFRNTSSEQLRVERINKNRAGSPCYKKILAFNTEFTEKNICTASRQYQQLKSDEINHNVKLTEIQKQDKIKEVQEKECLCEGLIASAFIRNNAPLSHKLSAVSICPGPNLYFFRSKYKLQEMVDHIYGKINLLTNIQRPHMFINEAKIYLDYLVGELNKSATKESLKQMKYYEEFISNFENGINYYIEKYELLKSYSLTKVDNFLGQLEQMKNKLKEINVVEMHSV